MKLCILSSGSKQNCFYIESQKNAVLIDVGFSYPTLVRYLSRHNIDISRIKALFITHEHNDHIRGLKSFIKHTDTPVFISDKSRHFLGFHLHRHNELLHEKSVILDDMEITPFNVSHDAANTFGFKIRGHDKGLFLASDIGCYNDKTVEYARDCEAIAIESNYDPEMLRKSSYPADIIKRIHGEQGHLSNEEAVNFIEKTVTGRTKNVFFLHLSENNNSRSIVSGLIKDRLISRYPSIQFHISSRDTPTGLIEL